METREVFFPDTYEAREVPITAWLAPSPSAEIQRGEQASYGPAEPDWPKVLPGYMVARHLGGYYARKRR